MARRLDISEDTAFKAFCSAPRLEILTTLQGLGTASVAEIAFALDRPADALYRHVNILVESGLVVEADTQKVGRQVETRYRLGADDSIAGLDLRDPGDQEKVRQTMRMMHRQAERLVIAAMEAGRATTEEDERNAMIGSLQAWLTADDLVELRARLEELTAFFTERQSRRGGALHHITLTLTPVERDRGFDARGSQRHEAMVREVDG